jgi:hypothetical protein
MRPSWFKISAILAGLWLVVGGVVWWLGGQRPSPEKVVALAAAQPVAGRSEAERMQAVHAVAAAYQQLDFDQRRELLVSNELRPWWTALSKPERRTFRMTIFPQSRQMVEFFDKFPPEQRIRNMKRVIEEVQKSGGSEALPGISQGLITTVGMTGLRPLYESSLLDENMDVLLMLHELERRLVWRRH